MAQWGQADRDQDWRDDAVRRSSPWLAARQEGRSLETILREGESHVPETVRRKLAWRFRKATQFTESATDESESEEDVDRCKKDSRERVRS